MTLDELKMRVDMAEEEGTVDSLCWQWLKQIAKDNGREGKIALDLMRIVEERLMP